MLERLDNFRYVYTMDDDFKDKNEVVYACIYEKDNINDMTFFIKNTSGKEEFETIRYDPSFNDYWFIDNDGQGSTLMRGKVLIWLKSEMKYFLYPANSFKSYYRKV